MTLLRCPRCGGMLPNHAPGCDWTTPEPVIPAAPTREQVEAAQRAKHVHPERVAAALIWLRAIGRTMASSFEYAALTGLPINVVNPIFTRLHQEGLIVRTIRRRRNARGNWCALYVAPEHWVEADGHVPSKPHRGRGQERDPRPPREGRAP